MVDVAVIAGLIGTLSLVRIRLKVFPLTMPMILVLSGVVLGSEVTGVLELGIDDESVALLAEFALALLLFSDASRINISSMRSVFSLPARLLFIGLPLTVLLGAVVTARLLDTLSVYEAALIAAMLAPTDAALGEAVVSNRSVPVRVRQALNIESGLNDGLVVPVVSILVFLVVGRELDGPTTLAWDAVREIGLGVAIGGGVAWVLARLLSIAELRQWTDSEGARLATFGSVLLVFSGTSVVDGNGFIAAFVCGALLRRFLPGAATRIAELSEDLGQVAASIVFVIFGAVLIVPSIEALSWRVGMCAVLTLTVGRMVPVGVATFGTNLRWPTVAFLGWFGPRGLASIVFGLLFVSEYGDEVEQADQVLAVVVLVVVLSVLLHGVTAAYGARRYSDWFHHHENPDLLEAMVVADDPMRGER